MATKSNSQISTIGDDIVEAEAAVAAPASQEITSGDAAMSGKKETITIHSSSEDGGSDAVFVGINGYAYQIPRDKPFVVPTEVAQVLRDAVTTTYKPGANGAVAERQMPRYAFSTSPV